MEPLATGDDTVATTTGATDHTRDTTGRDDKYWSHERQIQDKTTGDTGATSDRYWRSHERQEILETSWWSQKRSTDTGATGATVHTGATGAPDTTGATTTSY